MWFLSFFVYFYPFCTFFSLLSLYSVPLYFPLPLLFSQGSYFHFCYLLSCSSLSPVVLPDLSSHLKYFLPGLMEHCHGDCVMSLHGELLPRKLYDVIALETVTMVTELIEVTGNKGVVIRPEPGNAPFNGNNNKKRHFLCLYVPGRSSCDSKSPILFLMQCAQFGLLSVGLSYLAHLFLVLNVIVDITPQ